MISRIKLTNFKCFEEVDIKCSPLTLLCGTNGAGKSSVLQALLLLRQSFDSGKLRENKLNLNGNLFELGVGRDLQFDRASDNMVGIELTHSNQALFKANLYCSSDDIALDQLSFADESTKWGTYNNWGDSPPFGGEFRYVSADRIVTGQIYSRSDVFARRDEFGTQIELAINYLNSHRSDQLSSNDPRCANLENKSLLPTIDYWLQEIAPNTHLDIQAIENGGSLRVGSGLSCVLPVLVSLLSAPGTLCVVENPEALLHPIGQTKLAELAVSAALVGVQVMVETHSDHFLDRVRIAVREELIAPDQVAIHNFERTEGKSVVTTPTIDFNGRLSEWPSGFFDQFEKNLARLLVPKS